MIPAGNYPKGKWRSVNRENTEAGGRGWMEWRQIFVRKAVLEGLERAFRRGVLCDFSGVSLRFGT
jgi:hypothetical protein